MSDPSLIRLLADLTLLVHALFVAFVVFGFLLMVAGMLLHWSWVRNFWFRILHLLAMGLVVAETWLGQICPLTIWENDLRQAAGSAAYSGTFIQYWLQKLIFYEFPPWVFTVAYTLFGAMILISWILQPPRGRGRREKKPHT